MLGLGNCQPVAQGANPTSNLSGFSTPSGVPLSLTTYTPLYAEAIFKRDGGAQAFPAVELHARSERIGRYLRCSFQGSGKQA